MSQLILAGFLAIPTADAQTPMLVRVVELN
jgi:hypothetical protein